MEKAIRYMYSQLFHTNSAISYREQIVVLTSTILVLTLSVLLLI